MFLQRHLVTSDLLCLQGSWGREEEVEDDVSVGEVREYEATDLVRRDLTCSNGQFSQAAGTQKTSENCSDSASLTVLHFG